MTARERRNPHILTDDPRKASRKKRIAAGSGSTVESVNRLLKQHRQMADMMKAMGGAGKRGTMARLGQMFGMGGGEMMRAGRMLAQGDLRLIALALIAEQPRHGYEIIKVLEEKTSGWYSPSPGMVYPALTYLEEIGHASVEVEGTEKKVILFRPKH